MRKWLWALYGLVLYLFAANIIFIDAAADIALWEKVFMIFASGMLFLVYQFIPYWKRGMGVRLNTLMGGYELMMTVCAGVTIQSAILIQRLFAGLETGNEIAFYVASVILTLAAGFFMAVNGFVRIMFLARQIKLIWRILWGICWWIPGINLMVSLYICHLVSGEYKIESAKRELDEVRKESEICATKYPVLLVHGVFFRDWQYFNYWGRIPAALQKNGCQVYYGRHQSAAAVKDSAAELLEQIHHVIEETGCEKVNIIAHSKGGLDTRYAIDCLGAAPLVASLTTINTPHQGCLWVDNLLKKIPDGLVAFVAEKYNALYRRLGDVNPDFIAAVNDLTAKSCKRRQEEVMEADGYVKQSVMSLMKSSLSASFPLNLGFLLVKPVEGRNDGLVAENSAVWGKFLGVLTCKGRRGISHGDMIDLFRENIKGFDVREYYVMLVKGLKDMGL